MSTSSILVGAVLLLVGLGAPLAGQAAATAPNVGPSSSRDAAASSQTDQSADLLSRVVSLNLSDVPLGEALKEIDRQAELGLAYSPRVVPVDRRVTIRVQRMTSGDALGRVLQGTGVVVRVTADGAVTLLKGEVRTEMIPAARDNLIVGQVRDTAARPIARVEIILRGAGLTSMTNDSGIYQFRNVPPGTYTLATRLIGYLPATNPVTVADTQTVRVDFTLRAAVTKLTEVVTTATGLRQRYELSNDITVLNADSIVRTQPIASVTDLLDGRVPGLVVQRSSGAPGARRPGPPAAAGGGPART